MPSSHLLKVLNHGCLDLPNHFLNEGAIDVQKRFVFASCLGFHFHMLFCASETRYGYIKSVHSVHSLVLFYCFDGRNWVRRNGSLELADLTVFTSPGNTYSRRNVWCSWYSFLVRVTISEGRFAIAASVRRSTGCSFIMAHGSSNTALTLFSIPQLYFHNLQVESNKLKW